MKTVVGMEIIQIIFVIIIFMSIFFFIVVKGVECLAAFYKTIPHVFVLVLSQTRYFDI